MMWCVGVGARLGTLRFWLNLVLFLVSAYLAVAVRLSGQDVPSKDAWKPWQPLFVSIVVAGLYVAFFAFYEYLRAQGAAERERNTDVNRVCQQIAWRIISQCPRLDPAKLTVGVWLTKKDSFDRRIRFLLPARRPSSEISWRRGLGVVGSLWASGEPDRLEKLTARNAMSPQDFQRQPVADRLGLDYPQWQSVKAYTGVVAVKLVHDTGASKKLLGFLVIDYRGPLQPDHDGNDVVDCIAQALRGDDVSELRASLVTLLGKRA
jgi:hypothetical protein